MAGGLGVGADRAPPRQFAWSTKKPRARAGFFRLLYPVNGTGQRTDETAIPLAEFVPSLLRNNSLGAHTAGTIAGYIPAPPFCWRTVRK